MFIRNIFFVLSLLCMISCEEVKDYPWNSDWNQSESETPEEPEQPEEPETPEQPEQPEEPEQPETPEEPEQPEVPVEPEVPVIPDTPDAPVQDAAEWMDITEQFGELPSYISVRISPSTLEGKKAVAYIAVADMAQAQWDVWSVRIKDGALTEETTDAFRTPSEVYETEDCPIIINGGYFYYSGSRRFTASLAVRNSEVLAYNIGYEYDNDKMRYPVRAVFRESADGTFDACWTYVIWDKTNYMYSVPNDDPTKQPSATHPAVAEMFEAKTAIGGGPVLINDGLFVDSYVEEMFYGINPDTNQPRTAVGITSDDKMIFFVCEGREMTAGVYGLTTADVANVLLDLGCVEAINLDGGGSSCMLVNGQETIKVSDGSQRSVASTLMLK